MGSSEKALVGLGNLTAVDALNLHVTMALTFTKPQLNLSRHLRSVPRGYRPFEAIIDFFLNGLSLEQTVESLARPVEKAYEWEDSRGIESVLLRSTWQAFNSIVEQVPHEDSTNHTKLAQLLVHLRSRGMPDVGDARQTSYDGKI